MDSVAAQPIAPVGSSSRNPAARLAHLLRPLRKSSSARDLQQYSNYEDYIQQTPQSISPLDHLSSPTEAQFQSSQHRSTAFPYTPPTSFGFTSNKARLSRALAESGTGGDGNADYIPYRGPISPPSKISTSFANTQDEERGSDYRRVMLHSERHPQYLPHPETGPLMLQEGINTYTDWSDTGNQSKRSEIPRYKDVERNMFGLGLGLGQLETSNGATNAADTATAITRTRSLLGSGLPVAYTHGGNAPAVDSSSVPRSLANQSYLPSLLRFDPEAVERVGPTRSREIVFPMQGGTPLRQHVALTSSSRVSSSVNSSPITVFPPLMRQSYSADQTSREKANSLSSSDGNDSSLVNNQSASTSMTSLRDQQSFHKHHSSHDGLNFKPPTKARSRANTSSSASDKGKRRLEDFQHQGTEVIARDFVKTHGEVGFPGSYRTKSESHSLDMPAKYKLDETMVNRNLSPISGSTPGHTQEFSPRSTQFEGGDRMSNADQFERGRNNKRSSRMSEAHRNYLLLQQLHLEELAAHSTDHAGWLDTNNGCERIMMPRPSLRGRGSGSYDHVRNETTGKPTAAVTFERHRRLQTQSNPQLSESARAQEILSGGFQQQNFNARISGTVPLFHHRLPPPIPFRPPYVVVPPRSSSRSRRKRATATSTPALSPNLVSDGSDDEDGDDLATVLAQGRALEEEREQWREQYRRSIGKSRSQGAIRAKSRDQVGKKVRYREPLPDLKTFHKYANDSTGQRQLRQAKSTPDLRKSANQWHGEEGANKREVPSVCLPFPSVTAYSGRSSRQSNLHRDRSKSHDSFRDSFRLDSCFPSMTRRRRAKTMTEDDDEKRPRRMSQDRLDVFQHRTSSSLGPRHYTSQPQLVSDIPVIISRHSMQAQEKVKDHPSHIDSTSPNPNTFGIAFSAPRPDIGHSAPKDLTFAAGRHATKFGYHRPSNSDDLRAMLSSSPPAGVKNFDDELFVNQAKSVSRKPLRLQSDLDSEAIPARPASARNNSLGMSSVLQSIDDDKKTSSPLLSQAATEMSEQQSLPVPPRRQRSSQVISSSDMSSDLTSETKQFPTPPHFGTPFMAMEGFTTGGAFITPTLDQGWTSERDRGFFPQDQPRQSGETEGTNRTSEGDRVGETTTAASQKGKGLGGAIKPSGAHTLLPSSSDSEDSNYSPRSVAARELWNTDDHAEESFSGLFFKRLAASGSGMSNNTMTVQDITDVSQSESEATVSTPKIDRFGKVAGDPYESIPTTSNDSIYRSSFQGRRDSDEVGKIVGTYLNISSSTMGLRGGRRGGGGGGDESIEGASIEPAWNDSILDLSLGTQQQQRRREEARLGRIDGRRPTMIKQGHRGTNKVDNDDDDDDEDDDDDASEDGEGVGTPRPIKTRGRLSSFAASLVLTAEGEGSSPNPEDDKKQLAAAAEVGQ